MTDNDKMREEFEHYVATKTLMSLEKYTSGSYKHSSTQQSWETWQAARVKQPDELRAYEATVENHAERIRQLEAELCSKHNAIELLSIFQRNLGSDREMCDEHEGELWDRIDATCKALAAAQQQKKEN